MVLMLIFLALYMFWHIMRRNPSKYVDSKTGLKIPKW